MATVQKITPCLWFDHQAEEAAAFYTEIFNAGPSEKRSDIGRIGKYNNAGYEQHHKTVGSTLTVEFTLEGQSFIALNGGAGFKFNEALSLTVYCDTQLEIDYYWDKLSAGGDDASQQCGWLKDKFGLSWQIVPKVMTGMFLEADSAKSERAMAAMMQMKKIDLDAIEKAYKG